MSESMHPEVLEALRGSIAKWEAIVAGTGADKGGDNCPLCQLFIDGEPGTCNGCPVAERTGRPSCLGTPYGKWHVETPWPQDGGPRFATTDAQRVAAQEELDFLRSLLPTDQISTEPGDDVRAKLVTSTAEVASAPGDGSPVTRAPLSDINIHGKRLAYCDPCGNLAVLTRADCYGIETYACAECSGGELCPKCLDDAAYCECE